MPQQLRKDATEGSTFGVPFTFIDDAGQAAAPTSATWTLRTRNGTAIGTPDREVTPLAATATIVLSGDDLALEDRNDPVRFLVVRWRYNSTLGSNLPGVAELQFTVQPVAGTP